MKSLERRVSERVAAAQEKGDVTMAAVQLQKILREEREQEKPEIYSRGGAMRRRMDQLRRSRGR
jgi:hypothetical protein